MGLNIQVELEDGKTRTVPLDFDLSGLALPTANDIKEIDLVASEAHKLTALMMFRKLQTQVPEIDFDTFGPFFLRVLDGDGSVVVTGG